MVLDFLMFAIPTCWSFAVITVMTMNAASMDHFITSAIMSVFVIFPIAFFTILFGGIFLICVRAAGKHSNFYRDYKIFVDEKIRKRFGNVVYRVNASVPYATIISSGLLDKLGIDSTESSGYMGNDFLSVVYKNAFFRQCDVEFYQRHFKGQWRVFEFNKKFDSEVFVVSKNFRRVIKNLKACNTYKTIKTEWEEFNKKYIVFAKGEIEALSCLDPAVIEALDRARKKKNQVVFSFNGSMLHMCQKGHDFFEPDFLSGIDEERENAKIDVEIDDLVGVMDAMHRRLRESK